jgi:uncharacterized membrane protein
MIVLGALIHLPVRLVAVLGVVMIATHNLFDGVQGSALGAWAPLWTLLHSPNFVLPGPEHAVFVAYPLVPWVGVTAVGYALGSLWDLPADRRRALLLRLGFGCVVLFLVLRAGNVYGDPVPWMRQRSNALTVVSFLNLSKYPPSLLFLLMTLGPVLVTLSLLDGHTPVVLRPARVIGKVPLFYYLMHIVLLHVVALVASVARYGTMAPAVESPTLDRFPMTQLPGWPAPLPIVYLVWIGVVIALYPVCRWYAGVKQRSSSPWLSYL